MRLPETDARCGSMRAFALLALLSVAACGKTDGSSSAPVKPTASTPLGSGSTEPEAGVYVQLDSVKTISGKNDSAERAFQLGMIQLRSNCIRPALKLTPTFAGTVKLTLAINADGTIGKATPTVVDGKIPDEVQTCFAKYFEEKTKLHGHEATVEGTILIGPHVGVK